MIFTDFSIFRTTILTKLNTSVGIPLLLGNRYLSKPTYTSFNIGSWYQLIICHRYTID